MVEREERYESKYNEKDSYLNQKQNQSLTSSINNNKETNKMEIEDQNFKNTSSNITNFTNTTNNTNNISNTNSNIVTETDKKQIKEFIDSEMNYIMDFTKKLEKEISNKKYNNNINEKKNSPTVQDADNLNDIKYDEIVLENSIMKIIRTNPFCYKNRLPNIDINNYLYTSNNPYYLNLYFKWKEYEKKRCDNEGLKDYKDYLLRYFILKLPKIKNIKTEEKDNPNNDTNANTNSNTYRNSRDKDIDLLNGVFLLINNKANNNNKDEYNIIHREIIRIGDREKKLLEFFNASDSIFNIKVNCNSVNNNNTNNNTSEAEEDSFIQEENHDDINKLNISPKLKQTYRLFKKKKNSLFTQIQKSQKITLYYFLLFLKQCLKLEKYFIKKLFKSIDRLEKLNYNQVQYNTTLKDFFHFCLNNSIEGYQEVVKQSNNDSQHLKFFKATEMHKINCFKYDNNDLIHDISYIIYILEENINSNSEDQIVIGQFASVVSFMIGELLKPKIDNINYNNNNINNIDKNNDNDIALEDIIDLKKLNITDLRNIDNNNNNNNINSNNNDNNDDNYEFYLYHSDQTTDEDETNKIVKKSNFVHEDKNKISKNTNKETNKDASKDIKNKNKDSVVINKTLDLKLESSQLLSILDKIKNKIKEFNDKTKIDDEYDDDDINFINVNPKRKISNVSETKDDSVDKETSSGQLKIILLINANNKCDDSNKNNLYWLYNLVFELMNEDEILKGIKFELVYYYRNTDIQDSKDTKGNEDNDIKVDEDHRVLIEEDDFLFTTNIRQVPLNYQDEFYELELLSDIFIGDNIYNY